MLTGSLPRWPAIRYALCLASLIGLTMCESLDNLDVATAGKAVVPPATLLDKLLGPIAFGGFDTVDFSQDFKNQGVTDEQIDEVHMKAMTILVEAPAAGDFNFITSAHFFVQAEGLDKIEIASMDKIPQGKRELDLMLNTKVDLKPYVIAPSMKVSSEIKGQRPDTETTVAAAVVLDVDIHVPGCNK